MLIMGVALTSFWSHTIDHFKGFSLIHLLSIVTLVGVPLGISAARQGRIGYHKKAMTQIFVYALVVAGLFTLLPGRIIGQILFGG